MRRVVDVVSASVLLVLSAPVLLFAAAAVLIESGRPVFFGHVRVGRNGRVFRCWKLRTMEVNAEARLEREPALGERYRTNGYKLPAAHDPRITRTGRLLRAYYVDELPQLFNVLNGTMSLVGPRPVVPAELGEYGPGARELLERRPGVVGEWTSHGRTRPAYPERADVELEYLRNPSPIRDLRILVRTIPVVLRGQGDA